MHFADILNAISRGPPSFDPHPNFDSMYFLQHLDLINVVPVFSVITLLNSL